MSNTQLVELKYSVTTTIKVLRIFKKFCSALYICAPFVYVYRLHMITDKYLGISVHLFWVYNGGERVIIWAAVMIEIINLTNNALGVVLIQAFNTCLFNWQTKGEITALVSLLRDS